MLEALKNCPFCGGPADFVGKEVKGYNVECRHCGAQSGWGDYGYQVEAKWNRRAIQAVGPVTTVAVRPLEWKPNSKTIENSLWAKVEEIDRSYTIDPESNMFRLWTQLVLSEWGCDDLGLFPTVEAAKAAGQADHDWRIASRIRSALVATPPVSRKEQLEKRAAELVADMDAKGIKTLGDVARYCDHAEATPPAEPVVDAHPVYDELVRSRSKELHQKLGRDAMLRQNDPVQTIYDFAWSIWHDGFGEGMNEAEIASKPAIKDDETVVALPPTREYVDRIVRIFRDRPADDTSAVVLHDYARAALAAKDGRHE